MFTTPQTTSKVSSQKQFDIDFNLGDSIFKPVRADVWDELLHSSFFSFLLSLTLTKHGGPDTHLK